MDLHIFAEKRGEPTKYNLIKQSFGVNITLRETKKYYNNSEEPSIEKLELNCYESAFFYLGLTDHIPSKYFLATKHNAKKIKNDNQVRKDSKILNLKVTIIHLLIADTILV